MRDNGKFDTKKYWSPFTALGLAFLKILIISLIIYKQFMDLCGQASGFQILCIFSRPN